MLELITKRRNAKRTDQELMALLAQGQMEPLGELYVRYGGIVRSLVWRLLPDESVAEVEDITQEIFETIFQTAPRFRLDLEPRPWILGIAVRRARGFKRKMWVRKRLLRRYVREQSESVVEMPRAPDASDISKDQMERAIASLSQGQREVLLLFVLENMTGEQIAQALGLNLNTVWTRLRRARMNMRSALTSVDEDRKTSVVER